jgi:uncharacterized protein YhhL (DUF1145 family)
MFVQNLLAKTDMLKFWEYMFNTCGEDFNCVLGWLLAVLLGFLALVMGLGYLITRRNRREQ